MEETYKHVDKDVVKARSMWIEDLQVLLDVSNKSAQLLYSFLIKYIGHTVFEQLLEDSNKDTFDINIAPIGVAELKLQHNDDGYNISLSNIRFDPNFTSHIINTIECKESGLFNMEYSEQLRNIINRLEEFKEGKL